MRIECPGCKYFGEVPDDKIPEQGVSINCPKCKTKFQVNREEQLVDFNFEPVKPVSNGPPRQNATRSSNQRQGNPSEGTKQFSFSIPTRIDFKDAKVKYAAIGIGILFVLVSAFLYVKGTPQYSLYQFSKAVEAHDAETALKYFDVDSIVDNLVNDFVKIQEEKKPANEFEAMGKNFTKGLMAMMVPAMKEALKVQFKEGITKQSEDKSPLKKFNNFKWSDFEIKMEGNTAFLSRKDDKELTVKMVKTSAGHWKIVQLTMKDAIENIKNESKDELASITKAESSHSANEQSTPHQEVIQYLTVGKAGRDGGLVITLDSWQDSPLLINRKGSEIKAKDGSTFIGVTLKLTNERKDIVDINCSYHLGAALFDKAGKKYNDIGSMYRGANSTECFKILPGYGSQETLVFEIPTQLKPDYVMFWDTREDIGDGKIDSFGEKSAIRFKLQ